MPTTADRRRDVVARLLRERHIAKQEELLEALRKDGFAATQATLSRDLARLGARRVSAPEGGTRYELSDEERRDGLDALRAEGIDATQATLSRDLARLGARRVADPSGGTRYELAPEERRDRLEAIGRLVASVSCNGSLVVVRTHPGSAPAVARAIDLAHLPDVLGTLAGDDTVFIAPVREKRARALADRVRRLFEGASAAGAAG